MFARRARTHSAYRTSVPLALILAAPILVALTGVMSLMTIAAAQQATDDQAPAAKAKPAKKKSSGPKSEKAEKSETTEKKSDTKSPPAKKSNGKGNGAPATTAAVPAPGGGTPTLLGQYGDWGAYTASAGGRTVCYALAKPSSQATQPANRPRDPAYVFISTRPSENVRNEISIVIGYPFKPGYEASADIGANKYTMYTQADGAWVKNPAEEARMVDAMRKGADLVVSGGGTMNREAAALGVPVYSMFRGRIGAVDQYLVGTGRMTLLESVEDVYRKLVVRHRDHKHNRIHENGAALQTIVSHLVDIAEGTC